LNNSFVVDLPVPVRLPESSSSKSKLWYNHSSRCLEESDCGIPSFCRP